MADTGKESPPPIGEDDEQSPSPVGQLTSDEVEHAIDLSDEPEEREIKSSEVKEEKGLFDSEDEATASSPAEETKDDVLSSYPSHEAEEKGAAATASAAEETVPAVLDTEDLEIEDASDEFTLEIEVKDPQKVGDGMGAYMTYQVTTKTNIPDFKAPKTVVRRRFSDFLALHSKLVEKPKYIGLIIPSAPEKSVVGMTRVKFAKEESTTSVDFIEKRRSALERFLNRIGKHRVLRKDVDYREFLEQEDGMPKAKGTAALSGAGFMRLVKNVGEAVSKMTSKMEESDQWFEEKQQQLDNLDSHLKRLLVSAETLATRRRELGINSSAFAKSSGLLGSCEEHQPLGHALTQLAEVEEKIDQLQQEQAHNDYFIFGELLREYIGIIAGIKVCFQQRVKAFHVWNSAQATLQKKRDTETKVKASGKSEKLPDIEKEIKDWEEKVEAGRKEFEKISSVIKKEVAQFEAVRVREFKASLIKYLESLMNTQRQLINHWETFLPEAKAVV
ncbi:sorting nexin-2-like [Corticium candelabrum]|uniref:sorting nexin-2-like n=1 Tax=Corticium candelabrum TaxID=121492 RepID=UPI002E26A43F|nr:sorting nexin-2-like [Corticium candelabrum]